MELLGYPTWVGLCVVAGLAYLFSRGDGLSGGGDSGSGNPFDFGGGGGEYGWG